MSDDAFKNGPCIFVDGPEPGSSIPAGTGPNGTSPRISPLSVSKSATRASDQLQTTNVVRSGVKK